jgi:hypothetical protein
VSDPAQSAITADLASARFRAGVVRKQWRVISFEHPMLVVGVAAVEPDGAASEYAFRFDLMGFPGTAPAVLIWDVDAGAHLPANRRPKGSSRVVEAFKDWTAPHPVYRPWERTSGTHNNFAQTFPDLAWHPKRDLAFIMEDLHGLLSSNAAGRGAG